METRGLPYIGDRQIMAMIIGRRAPVLATTTRSEICAIGSRGAECCKDLRSIVQILTVGIRATKQEPVSEAMRSLYLQAVVVGGRCILAQDDAVAVGIESCTG